MASKSISTTSNIANMNIIPAALSTIKVTAFESRQVEWLDDNYYDIAQLFPAICCRMVNRGVNPHDHITELKKLQSDVCNLMEGVTLRTHIGGCTVIVFHRDCATSYPYELVMY